MIRTDSSIEPDAFKSSLSKLTRGIVAKQLIGNLVLLLLVLAWLRIPDSHGWQFILSMLSSLLVVFAFLWLQAETMTQLRVVHSNPRRSMQILFVVIFSTLWVVILRPISSATDHAQLFAGLINSQLSAHLRYLFSYDRLLQIQLFIYEFLRWLVAGLILPFVMETVALGFKSNSFRRASQVCLHRLYWIAVYAAGFIGTKLTKALITWTPGKGVAGETASVVARLGIAYTVDILLWCFMLALVASYLDRANPTELGIV